MHNSIQYRGNCGFAQSGQAAYVINSDTSHAYNVTVLATGDAFSQTTQSIVYVVAGGSAYAGCTASEDGQHHWTWSVIGEQQV